METVQEPRKRGRPTKEEVAARQRVEEDAQLIAAAASAPAPVLDGNNAGELLLAMAKQIAQLQDQLAVKKAAEPPVEPNPARRLRKHIMVMVKPGTEVRVEVPDDYAGPGRSGSDPQGPTIKGYINHENTVLFR